MADRAQNGRLHGVAAAKRFRLECVALTLCLARTGLARQPFAVERGGEERCEHRADSCCDLGIGAPRCVEEQPTDDAIARAKLDPSLAEVGCSTRIELDPAMRRPKQAGGPRRDGLEARLDLDALEQERGDVSRQRRFSAALLGLLRAPASASRQPAHADRRDEVHGERDPVLGVREAQRVRRRQEQPVEREHAHDRHRDRERQAPDRRHRQNGEEVENAEAENRCYGLEGEDGCAGERDRAEAEQRCHELPKQPVSIENEPLRSKRAHQLRIRTGPKETSRFP